MLNHHFPHGSDAKTWGLSVSDPAAIALWRTRKASRGSLRRSTGRKGAGTRSGGFPHVFQGLVNVLIKHHPTFWGYNLQQIFKGDVKQIPKKGDLPTPVFVAELGEKDGKSVLAWNYGFRSDLRDQLPQQFSLFFWRNREILESSPF